MYTCTESVYLPDAGEDKGDDGEAGHAPHHAHLHVQEPGREVSPLCRPELQAAITLKDCVVLEYLELGSLPLKSCVPLE